MRRALLDIYRRNIQLLPYLYMTQNIREANKIEQRMPPFHKPNKPNQTASISHKTHKIEKYLDSIQVPII